MMKTIFGSVVMILISSLAPAQEAPAKHKLRVLALGDSPPYRHELKDGIMQEIAPPEGSLPPREITIGLAATTAKKPNGPMMLRLCQPTAAKEVTVGEDGLIPLLKDDAQRWLSVKVPTTRTASIAMLLKKGSKWNKPVYGVYPDDPSVRKGGAVQITNMTSKPMGLTVGKDKFLLPSTKEKMIVLTEANPRVTIVLQYENQNRVAETFYNSQLEYQAGMHQRLVIYPSDGEVIRNPVATVLLTDPL